MKTALPLAILLTALFWAPPAAAQKAEQAPEPSLEITLGWIKEKIGLYRDVKLDNAQGRNMTETFDVPRIEGCSLFIRHTETDNDVTVSTVYELPLRDYLAFEPGQCRMFSVYTSGSSVSFTRQVESSGTKLESSTDVTDHVVIQTRKKGLDNCDLQKRLKKAFDHAAELCVSEAPRTKDDPPPQPKKKRKPKGRS